MPDALIMMLMTEPVDVHHIFATCMTWLEAASKVPSLEHGSLHVMLIASCVVMLSAVRVADDALELFFSLSLSLSLYIYIYNFTYTCMESCIQNPES